MKRRFIPILAALTCVLLLAGCQKAGPSPLPGSDVSSSVPIPETEDTDQSTPSDSGSPLPDLSVNQSPGSSPDEPEGPAVPVEPSVPDDPPVQEEPAETPPPVVEEPAPPVDNHTLYILMYHHFVPDTDEELNDWTLTESRFREDLQWLADNGYTTVLPRELAAGEPLPEKAVMLTFDDGYASNYQIAYPLLQEFQAKAAIAMIVRRTVDAKPDFLTWEMCREMAQSGLVEFGSHTYDSHKEADPRGILHIKEETPEEYAQRIFPDLQASIDLIEENVGIEVDYFAYPHGQTDSWSDAYLTEHFSVSVTTRHGAADIRKGLYQMPRHNITMRAPVSQYLP